MPKLPLLSSRQAAWGMFATVVGIGACAATIGFVSTWWGVVVGPDSISYLNLKGDGIGANGYAPMYGWILFSFCDHCDVYAKARFLAVLVFMANAIVTYLVVLRATGAKLLAIASAAFVVFSKVNLAVQSAAMSDGLFLLFVTLSIYAISHYLDAPSARRALITGAIVAATFLTRWAGLPVFIAAIFCMLVLGNRVFVKRIADIALFMCAGALPVLLWIQPWSQGMGVTGRGFAFHGTPDAEVFIGGLREFAALLVSDSLPRPVLAAVILAVLMLMTFVVLRHWRLINRVPPSANQQPSLVWLPLVSCAFIACYVPFIVLSTFIEANLPILGRYVLPLLPALVLLFATAGHRLLSTGLPGAAAAKPVLLGVVLLLLFGNTIRAGASVWKSYEQGGTGMRSVEWMQSPTVIAVKQLPTGFPLFSNGRRSRGPVP